MGKAESTTAWWEEVFWRGRAWRVCRVLPELHHAPWAKHTGTGRENRPASPAAAGPDPGKSRISSAEVKRGGTGATREADVAGQEGQNRLLGSSVVWRPSARRGGAGRVAALGRAPGLRTRHVFSPRRVHLNPKVHLSRLFEYSWKELSLVIFIKSLSP